MAHLLAFAPSIRTLYWAGGVDFNDSTYCYYSVDASYVTVTCYTSEQRDTPTFNYIALWRK
jgi:hypothetical protein